ncbi:MAG: hypothetical protein IJU76_05110 [Desulfovibrionaceae bacterium]|nr:hypothetical protein [Desulfovibrionaceae bacterium]
MRFTAVFSATIHFTNGNTLSNEKFIFRYEVEQNDDRFPDTLTDMGRLNIMLGDYLMCTAGYDPSGYAMIPLESALGVTDYRTEHGNMFAIGVKEIGYFFVNELIHFHTDI